MEEHAKKAASAVTGFVYRHRVGLMFVATTVGLVAANRVAIRDHDNFLKSKGLYNEYYCIHPK